MKLQIAPLAITLWAAGLALPAYSCDLCSVYNASLAHGVIEQGFYVSLAEQFTHMGTTQFESSEVPNEANQKLDSSVSQAVLGYRFTDRLGVQVNVPYIYRDFRRAEGGEIEHGTESGLGDVSLSANYLALRRDHEQWSVAWALHGGVKFPTGDSDRLKEELEEEAPVPGEVESAIHGHDLTLGSGSYDGFVGTDFYVRWARFFFTAETQYAIRSEGDFDYRYANDLTWAGGPGYYLVLNDNLTIGLQVLVSGESKGRDEFQGEKAEDTGLTAVYLGPSLTISWQDRLGVELAGGLPVDIQNSAFQIVPDYRVNAALTLRF